MPRFIARLAAERGWWGLAPAVWLCAVLAMAAVVAYGYRAFPDVNLLEGWTFVRFFHPDSLEFLEAAYNVHLGNGMRFNGVPTAFREPGAILYFAGWFSLAGVRYGTVLAADALMVGVTILAVAWLGQRLYDRSTGLVAAALMAGNLAFITFAMWPLAEGLFVAALTVMTALIVRHDETGNWSYALAAGVAFGVATMSRSNVALFAPVLLALVLRRGGFRQAVLAMVPLALMMGAWTARNYGQFHRVIPAATRLGMTMANDNSLGALTIPFSTPWQNRYMPPAEVTRHWQGLHRSDPMAEIVYNDRCLAQAKLDMAAHPWLYARRCARRVVALVSPYLSLTRPRWFSVAQALKWLLVMVPGTIVLWQERRRPWAQATWGLALMTTVAIALIIFDNAQRYRLTFEPLFTVAAAAFWARRLRADAPETAATQPISD